MKIITYNAKWYFDNDKTQKTFVRTSDMNEKTNKIVQLLSPSEPDIICLQELEGYNDVSKFENIYGKPCNNYLHEYRSIVLTELCNSFNNYYKSKNINIIYKYAIGNADTSKQRVGILINVNNITKSNFFIKKTKCGLKHLGFEFVYNNDQYLLLNIHLKSKLNNNEEKRLKQAEEIKNIIAQYYSHNIIVCGDFNMVDNSLGKKDDDKDCYTVIKNVQVGGNNNLFNAWSTISHETLAQYESHFYDKNNNKKVDDGELSIIDAFLLSNSLKNKLKEIRPLLNLELNTKIRMISDHIPLLLQLK